MTTEFDNYAQGSRMNVFVTGFPGFLGSQLVPRLLGLSEDVRVHCLVEHRFLGAARALSNELPENARSRLTLHHGDIVLPGLGLDGSPESFDEIYHLAAVYDLGVSEALAYDVNVLGTRNVLRFAEGLSSLKRFHYISTCYVSGTFTGAFRDTDLVRGQRFLNHYEATKYASELDVRSAMERGMPTTIYRPSIVVGNSSDGSTTKLDGPYPIIRWMNLLPGIAILPVVGDPSEHRVNLVPSDWLVDVLFELSRTPASLHKVYQLCDPDPPTVNETIDMLARAAERRVIRIPLPMPAARVLIRALASVLPAFGLKPQMLDYFRHPGVHVASDLEADLGASYRRCPRLEEYAPAMVGFVRHGRQLPPSDALPQRRSTGSPTV